MPETTSSSRALETAFIVLGVIVIAVALLFAFTGIGAKLGKKRQITVTVRVQGVFPEVAEQIKAGETIYVEPAGLQIGKIESVSVFPTQKAVRDWQGGLKVAESPLEDDVDVKIVGTGREGDNAVAFENRVVQVGDDFIFSTGLVRAEGTVLKIDVH